MAENSDALKAALGIFQASLITIPCGISAVFRAVLHVFLDKTTVASAIVAFGRGVIRNLVGRYSSRVTVFDKITGGLAESKDDLSTRVILSRPSKVFGLRVCR